MKNIKFAMLIFSLLLPGYSFCEEAEVVQAKVLKCSSIAALSGVLEAKPDGAAQILTSLENSKKITAGIKKLEDALKAKGVPAATAEKYLTAATVKFKKMIIDPIRNFFGLLYEYKSLLQPMVEESLGDGRTVLADSLLYKFLSAKEGEVNTFFEDNVTTKDQLVAACKDFEILFGDLEVTMPRAFESGKKWLKDLEKANTPAAS